MIGERNETEGEKKVRTAIVRRRIVDAGKSRPRVWCAGIPTLLRPNGYSASGGQWRGCFTAFQGEMSREMENFDGD